MPFVTFPLLGELSSHVRANPLTPPSPPHATAFAANVDRPPLDSSSRNKSKVWRAEIYPRDSERLPRVEDYALTLVRHGKGDIHHTHPKTRFHAMSVPSAPRYCAV